MKKLKNFELALGADTPSYATAHAYEWTLLLLWLCCLMHYYFYYYYCHYYYCCCCLILSWLVYFLI